MRTISTEILRNPHKMARFAKFTRRNFRPLFRKSCESSPIVLFSHIQDFTSPHHNGRGRRWFDSAIYRKREAALKIACRLAIPGVSRHRPDNLTRYSNKKGQNTSHMAHCINRRSQRGHLPTLRKPENRALQ